LLTVLTLIAAAAAAAAVDDDDDDDDDDARDMTNVMYLGDNDDGLSMFACQSQLQVIIIIIYLLNVSKYR